MALNAKQRRKSATIAPSAAHPTGRFPMPDKSHARLALSLLGKAKGLTEYERADVVSRARKMLSDNPTGDAQPQEQSDVEYGQATYGQWRGSGSNAHRGLGRKPKKRIYKT